MKKLAYLILWGFILSSCGVEEEVVKIDETPVSAEKRYESVVDDSQLLKEVAEDKGDLIQEKEDKSDLIFLDEDKLKTTMMTADDALSKGLYWRVIVEHEDWKIEYPTGYFADFEKVIKDNDIEKVKEFLREDGYVHRKTIFSETPLMVASKSGNLEIIKLVIDAWADLDDWNEIGNTAYFMLVESKSEEEAKIEGLKLFVESGLDPNANNGMLYNLAIQLGNVEFLDYLIEKWLVVNALNGIWFAWQEPFDIALYEQNYEMAKALLERWAKFTDKMNKHCAEKEKFDNLEEKKIDDFKILSEYVSEKYGVEINCKLN